MSKIKLDSGLVVVQCEDSLDGITTSISWNRLIEAVRLECRLIFN